MKVCSLLHADSENNYFLSLYYIVVFLSDSIQFRLHIQENNNCISFSGAIELVAVLLNHSVRNTERPCNSVRIKKHRQTRFFIIIWHFDFLLREKRGEGNGNRNFC